MRRPPSCLPFLLLTASCINAAPRPIVTAVVVPATNLQVNLATQVGRPYDSRTVERDVRYLWGLGRFDDVRVEAEDRAGGVALTFRVVPSPNLLLHQVRLLPNTFGLQVQLPELTPINRLRAHEIAMDAQRQLNAGGYPNARVSYALVPAARQEVDLKLTVETGGSLRVHDVLFQGDSTMRGRLRALRIRRILFWRLLPAYRLAAVDSDTGRLQSAYVSRGYFDAKVRNDVEIRGKDAHVTMAVETGPLYSIPPGLCASLFAERRDAQRRGILDFSARLNPDGGVTVDRGRAYRVGRIGFAGNHQYSDSAIRRNLLLDEGALFDERLLRAGVARLNRTGWFRPIEDRDVAVHPDQRTGLADVTVRLTERKFGAWKFAGPVGPLSLEGPVQASISARLPRWGRGALELSTYTASVSLFAFGHPLLPILNGPKGFTPVLALQRSYTPGEGWKSGFAIAPRLGWRVFAAGYIATQLQERLSSLLAGERRNETALPVAVARPRGDVTMWCEPPKPHLGLFRAAAGVGLHFLGTLPAL